MGQDHVAERFQKYEMTLRDYIRNNRCPKDLNKILLHVVNGVEELHHIGYQHRDLKPDNIVLNINPLEVRVIDFNRVVTSETNTLGHWRGTPGYSPIR